MKAYISKKAAKMLIKGWYEYEGVPASSKQIEENLRNIETGSQMNFILEERVIIGCDGKFYLEPSE